MPISRKLSADSGQPQRSRALREESRLALTLGSSLRLERRRRRLTLRQLAAMSGLSKTELSDLELGEVGSVQAYVFAAQALGLRAEFELVDPRRMERPQRQVDLVHAAMGEVEAQHFRGLGFEVRLDEPYQHFQFAGRADVVAWSREEEALLHIENKTELDDLQDLFGSFNAKRAYLGAELAPRVGVKRWAGETHVVAALWSADVLRVLRRHRASFESVCPDAPEALAEWWSGGPTARGRHAILVVFDPLEGKRSDRRRWAGLAELDGLRPRHLDYAEVAKVLRTRRPA